LRFEKQYVATGRDGPTGSEVIADLVVMQAQGLVEEMLFDERGRERGDYQGSTYTYSNLKMSPFVCSTDLILHESYHMAAIPVYRYREPPSVSTLPYHLQQHFPWTILGII